MTQAEATALVAKLFAAFPFHRDNDELTAAVYVEQLEQLPDLQIGLQTVNDLISIKRYLPAVAEVREHYDLIVEARRARVKALEEPPLTPEQVEENLRHARAFLERLRQRGAVFAAETEGDVEARRAKAASL